jgi:16S rRNA G966 N2-methylase RsmD
LESNAALLKGLAEVSLLVMSAERALGLLERQGRRFDLVFLDPPYGQDLARTTLEQLALHADSLLGGSGRVVVETQQTESLPDAAGSLVKDGRDRLYGTTRLTFYREKGAAA